MDTVTEWQSIFIKNTALMEPLEGAYVQSYAVFRDAHDIDPSSIPRGATKHENALVPTDLNTADILNNHRLQLLPFYAADSCVTKQSSIPPSLKGR